MSQESRILRNRQAAHDAAFDAAQAGGDADGSAAMLCQTTVVGSYPGSATAYFAVNPVSAGGSETEGGAASLTPDTSTVLYALNLGTSVPPQGTTVVCHSVGGRWTFRYD